jgi:hypothetical protein
MPSVNVHSLTRRVDSAGRFEVFRKLKVARVHPDLLREIDGILYDYARHEADRATREWYAARSEDGLSTSDLANLTLMHYEKALRKLRPNFELEFVSGGAEKHSRYRGVKHFLRWLSRQREMRPRALKVSFVSDSTSVLVQLRNSPTADRSYIWAAGSEYGPLEALFNSLSDALRRAAGKGAWLRSWPTGLMVSSVVALLCAAGVAFRLHGHPWPTVLSAAVAVDFGLGMGLVFLFRQAWPAVVFDFPGVDVGGKRLRFVLRACYAVLGTGLALAGAWAILTTFVRFVW